MIIRDEDICSFLLGLLQCHWELQGWLGCSPLFGMGIPSPVCWQVGICSVPLPAGLRAGWGFLLGSPFHRRTECGTGPGCSCCSTSSLFCVVWVSGMHSGEDPPDPVGEHRRGMGRAGICKRGLGKGKGKSQSNSMGKEAVEWGVLSNEHVLNWSREDNKVLKCVLFSSYFSFSLIFIQP